MGKLLIAGTFMAFSAAATAGETGVINQAGPYEATMRFYLHPAHGFPGKDQSTDVAVAEAKEKPAAHVNESDKTLQAAAQTTSKDSRYQLRQVAARDNK